MVTRLKNIETMSWRNILIEEIRQMNPELISEEERKLEKLGFKLGNPSF